MRRSGWKEMNACTDLNFPQWEHIMHHQLIPSERWASIRMHCIHHLRECPTYAPTDLNSFAGNSAMPELLYKTT